MLRSMTGFGRSVMEEAHWTQTWEIKSANSRYLDIKWRLPTLARSLEAGLERGVRRVAARGRVEITLNVQSRISLRPVRLDAAQARSMLAELGGLAEAEGLDFTPDLNRLFGIAALWTYEDDDPDAAFMARLEAGLNAALEDWNESREQEGRALGVALKEHIRRMEEWLACIDARAPDIREERFAALRERLAEAMDSLRLEADEGRILQELVILTDRIDVSEELTRLHTHVERLHELLETGTDSGRRLDFTLQECLREINTCGNKIQDARLSRIVVDFKNELEKFREQVQNLE
jgi:uncharacterized protein (TIGR00255 family)